mmetsp:Transcript_10519/g.29729  ORF Transcript_10519/g.29729 Transcript_10519/m.29729 type:complete len:211 (-) Transcript_10519:97-729(-)
MRGSLLCKLNATKIFFLFPLPLDVVAILFSCSHSSSGMPQTASPADPMQSSIIRESRVRQASICCLSAFHSLMSILDVDRNTRKFLTKESTASQPAWFPASFPKASLPLGDHIDSALLHESSTSVLTSTRLIVDAGALTPSATPSFPDVGLSLVGRDPRKTPRWFLTAPNAKRLTRQRQNTLHPSHQDACDPLLFLLCITNGPNPTDPTP